MTEYEEMDAKRAAQVHARALDIQAAKDQLDGCRSFALVIVSPEGSPQFSIHSQGCADLLAMQDWFARGARKTEQDTYRISVPR